MTCPKCSTTERYVYDDDRRCLVCSLCGHTGDMLHDCRHIPSTGAQCASVALEWVKGTIGHVPHIHCGQLHKWLAIEPTTARSIDEIQTIRMPTECPHHGQPKPIDQPSLFG